MAADAPARLLPLTHEGLPGWADRFLAAPGDDFFASRLWFDLTLAAALPADVQPTLALAGEDETLLLPLLSDGGRLRGLTTPYSLAWRPLFADTAGHSARVAASRSFARALRNAPPAMLDLLDPEDPSLAPLREGLAAAGLRAMAFDHVVNWHEVLPAGTTWKSYLASRTASLRNTVTRKLARGTRDFRFELVASPGASLEAAIADYEAVRAQSWKPDEPFPAFDAALLRATAAVGIMRLGVLRTSDGAPVAAQYWIIDRGGARATVLKLSHCESARAASPGTVLTAMMVRHLLDTDAVGELDFGRGDDPYKAMWAAQRRQRIGLILADWRHPAGLAAILRQAAGTARRRLRARFART